MAPTPEMEEGRSATELLGAIADETITLVRKEAELARQEVNETVTQWLRASVAIAAGAALGVVTLMFVGLAVESLLAFLMPDWAARLIVATLMVALAGAAVGFARNRMKGTSIVPHDATRTVKEDVEWAKAQLRR